MMNDDDRTPCQNSGATSTLGSDPVHLHGTGPVIRRHYEKLCIFYIAVYHIDEGIVYLMEETAI